MRILCLIIFSALVSFQTESSLSFETKESNFGKIKSGSISIIKFNLKNTSDKIPLIIYSVSTSCGCTSISSPKIIKPKQTEPIIIKFNSKGYNGLIIKSIIVITNTKHDYVEEKYSSFFAYNYMSIKNDSLYVTYSADSFIYVYDKDNNLSHKFGVSGPDMKNSYLLAKSLNFYMDNFKMAHKNYGFYTSIYVDEDYVFRSYTKNKGEIGGLQIYKNEDLIYDIEVPKKFNVIGKINDCYYADGIVDEEKNILGVFKFEIK